MAPTRYPTHNLAHKPTASITLVAAMGRNRAIGLDGHMPWHLPAELAHFKRTTMGKPIVMGRRTWQAIGRALPGRQNIVLSRDAGFEAPGADVVRSLEEALEVAVGDEVMVIGGGALYRLALPLASRMVLTVIDVDPKADTWFPEWDEAQWQVEHRERHEPGEDSPLGYEILTLSRKPGSPAGPPAGRR